MYRLEDDLFEISYSPDRVPLQVVFTAIRALGVEKGGTYKPILIIEGGRGGPDR
ncbi:MAG: hypothetical protein JRG73_11870 [Deltaproteobacteria bacterium]|nr:hypothetical protein [Deltaproteobacteria bacterium]